jgi:hypothetical protein
MSQIAYITLSSNDGINSFDSHVLQFMSPFISFVAYMTTIRIFAGIEPTHLSPHYLVPIHCILILRVTYLINLFSTATSCVSVFLLESNSDY